ncbi:hypothetical protein [Syntrophorhabdus aromaticivorans]|jgi:hypothetical protein|uniref:hypothetical protein n=1 Tax=Syntrophorhabdus aromaticivorans TaxID=328301 RepID=UPI0003FD30D8|nr:hypothetical protein [Syntrophorhabdus aromaticivorans]
MLFAVGSTPSGDEAQQTTTCHYPLAPTLDIDTFSVAKYPELQENDTVPRPAR